MNALSTQLLAFQPVTLFCVAGLLAVLVVVALDADRNPGD